MEWEAAGSTILEVVPPTLDSGLEGLYSRISRVRRLVSDGDFDAVNIPEIHDEENRNDQGIRTRQYSPRMQPRELGRRIQDELGLPVIINHVVSFKPIGALMDWIRETVAGYGIRNIVLVGAPHERKPWPGPPVPEANAAIRTEFGKESLKIGNICIPGREGSPIPESVRMEQKALSGADFFTTDYNELISRPEVTATIIATDENQHFGPTMAAIERGHNLFIEKPLATEAKESLEIFNAIEAAGLDAVVGYTQRFRRRFLAVKERLVTGQIGDVSSVVARAFMNRMVPIATITKTNQRHNLTPMVVSGTHSLDMSMWLMEGKTPISVYARSTDPVLAEWGTKDSTFGIFTMDDGAIFSMNICWGLPQIWPGSVYGLEIGIVGTVGAIGNAIWHATGKRIRHFPIGIPDLLG